MSKRSHVNILDSLDFDQEKSIDNDSPITQSAKYIKLSINNHTSSFQNKFPLINDKKIDQSLKNNNNNNNKSNDFEIDDLDGFLDSQDDSLVHKSTYYDKYNTPNIDKTIFDDIDFNNSPKDFEKVSSKSINLSSPTPISTNSSKKLKLILSPNFGGVDRSKTSTPIIVQNVLKTPGTTTTTSKSNQNGSLISLTENKNREIGYSAYNQLSGDIQVGQFCDTQTYVHLYTKLFILNATLIVTPPLGDDSELIKMISLRFKNCRIVTIPRKLFNENSGLILLEKYSIPDKYISLDRYCQMKYLLYASFNALIRYLEGFYDITFISSCIRIHFAGSERTMLIDAETIKNLELIHNQLDGSRKNTLYDSINHTKTPQGSRLLISNIVQPPNDISTIRLRQDAIKEILKNERSFFSLLPMLSKIPDIDRILLAFCQTKSKKVTLKKIEQYISNLISLKSVFEILPKISSVISNIQNSLIKSISQNLSNRCIQDLMRETAKYLCDDKSTPQQKGKLPHNVKIVHYIRTGINGYLDVCKKTYQETLNDINNLTSYYSSQYKLDQLKLMYSATKGYYYQLPCKNTSLFHLPKIFTRDEIKNQKCTFTSEELLSLSRRNKEVFEEIILLSCQSIETLIDQYRHNISALFNISESLSLLDMILSLSSHVTTLDPGTCPIIQSNGPLALKKGFHPLQLKRYKQQQSQFIPNDTMICETSNFQLIHGPNMSGKSTYIQQVAILTIMAHIGCYLPAEFASIPIVDKVISRIGTSDNLQSNASTFMTEMKEISYILENCTEKSLVIVDELGRGTSNLDGSSIAWAISEKIATTIGCFTLFVTHYQELLSLTRLYQNIKSFHLGVSRENEELKYSYTLNEGISDHQRYGIDIAELSGIHPLVIQTAKMIRNTLESQQLMLHSNDHLQQYQHPLRNAYTLIQKLLNLGQSMRSESDIKQYLMDLKSQYHCNSPHLSTNK
ncbi:hypothetical protein DLAC_02319 [Tieghemostelium lacteum]|uniref:DNA mismatch repair proteins mutS family domain-containing protein n=1 Tax=Tieghemostelium lacteum TaxID=361077 RepID=A0A152A4P1_TIELA|nr:hypothetical protein DLAC_02319 [Tieghemostelium lacteum]|eukprot:KYR01202.1 hypothetical protein DLAC_02319 [Tieghemostelium lacteum]